MSLNYLAHAGTMSGTGTLFGHSKNGIALVLQRMLEPLGQLFRDELIPIDQNIVHHKLTTSPLRSAFEGCIGAIDGTHIHVFPEAEESLQWRGRSGDATTNCMGICDHDMLFTYFYVGCQGAFHDSRVLLEAQSRPENGFPTPLPGRYYLGDSGYANRIGFLTPFRGTSYHPHQFNGRRPSNKKEMFNKQHSSLRSVIERTFGIWKNKWHIVHYPGALVGFKLRKQLAIIQATVGLHNFVRRNSTPREIAEEDIRLRESQNSQINEEVDNNEENRARRLDDVPMEQFRDELADRIYLIQTA